MAVKYLLSFLIFIMSIRFLQTSLRSVSASLAVCPELGRGELEPVQLGVVGRAGTSAEEAQAALILPASLHPHPQDFLDSHSTCLIPSSQFVLLGTRAVPSPCIRGWHVPAEFCSVAVPCSEPAKPLCIPAPLGTCSASHLLSPGNLMNRLLYIFSLQAMSKTFPC